MLCRWETDLREVLTGMRATRLLASSGGSDGLNGTLENVAELKGLNKVAVEWRSRQRPH